MRRTLLIALPLCLLAFIAAIAIVGTSNKDESTPAPPPAANDVADANDPDAADDQATNGAVAKTDPGDQDMEGLLGGYRVYARLNLAFPVGTHVTIGSDGKGRQCVDGSSSEDFTMTQPTDSKVLTIDANDSGYFCGTHKSYDHFSMVLSGAYVQTQRLRLGQLSGFPPWPYALECNTPNTVKCVQNGRMTLSVSKP